MWWGLSTIGAWGNQQGFNIVNFILLYCIGAICKLNNIVDKWKSFKYLIPLLIGIVVMVFLWAYFEESITRFGMRSAWCYHNPLVIFLVTFNYFNAFSLGKGHFFAPSRLYNGPAYAQNRYDEKLSTAYSSFNNKG